MEYRYNDLFPVVHKLLKIIIEFCVAKRWCKDQEVAHTSPIVLFLPREYFDFSVGLYR